MKDGRSPPLFGVQMLITRRHRQTRLFANDWPHDYLRIERQIANHLFDQDRLLRVLLAKESEMRPHSVEQDRHDRGHAAKMPWARSAFQLICERLNADVSRKSRRIHVFAWRRKYIIDVLVCQQRGVAL